MSLITATTDHGKGKSAVAEYDVDGYLDDHEEEERDLARQMLVIKIQAVGRAALDKGKTAEEAAELMENYEYKGGRVDQIGALATKLGKTRKEVESALERILAQEK